MHPQKTQPIFHLPSALTPIQHIEKYQLSKVETTDSKIPMQIGKLKLPIYRCAGRRALGRQAAQITDQAAPPG